MQGNSNAVEELIHAGVDISYLCRDGNTLLHTAIKMSRARVAEVLITAGIELNQPCARGQHPLHMAVSYGRHEIVSYLIEAGVDINVPDLWYGKTAIQLAVYNRRRTCVEVLLKAGANLCSPINVPIQSKERAVEVVLMTLSCEIVAKYVSGGGELKYGDKISSPLVQWALI